MFVTVAKGLLFAVLLGSMSMLISAEDSDYPNDKAAAEFEKEEGRIFFGTATGTGSNLSITLGNEALLLIPLAFLGLLLLGAVVATLFGIGGFGDTGTGATGYDTYSTYDVMRSGLNHGYQALEDSSYQVARALVNSAKKFV